MAVKTEVKLEVKLLGVKLGEKNYVVPFLKCMDGSVLAFLKCMAGSVLGSLKCMVGFVLAYLRLPL